MRDGGEVQTLCQHCQDQDACGQGRGPCHGVARPEPLCRAVCGAWPDRTGGLSRGPGPCSASRSSRGTATQRPSSRGKAQGTRGDGSRAEGRGGHHYTLARYKLKHCRAHNMLVGILGVICCWSVMDGASLLE